MSIHESSDEVGKHLESALQLLEEHEARKLSEFFESLHPVELVALLNAAEPEIQPALLKHITGLDQLSELIAHAGDHLRQRALAMIDDSRIAAVIRRQDIDDAADVLGSLPRRRQVRVLRRLGAARVKELTSLLAYDQDTAGRIMNTRFLAFPLDLTAGEALADLRRRLANREIDENTYLSYGFFLDHSGILRGVMSLRELLSAPTDAPLQDLYNKELITVRPEDHQQKAARLIADYDFTALPVISDENERMLGIVTVDDIIDVIEEEHTEELLKLAGTEDQDTVGASLNVAVFSRLPWLAASWCGGIGGAMLLGSFETTLEKVVALAFFMPVVFGMGGNVGSQSATITVRGLATGELGETRIIRRLRKETTVGAVLGLCFGLLLSFVSFLLYNDARLSLTVGASILGTMTFAAALGSMLPVLFQRFGIDPAVASGPLVTTTTDICSISIYFTIAGALL